MATNWTKIKNEYISGHITYQELAAKHGVSYNTLRGIALKEHWFEKRKKQREKISEKSAEKTAEKIAERESDLQARIVTAAEKLLEKIELATDQLDTFLAKDKRQYEQAVKDPKTGKTIPIFITEEVPKVHNTGRINKAELKQLASALKDLRDIQTVHGDKQGADTSINLIISPATKEDVPDD